MAEVERICGLPQPPEPLRPAYPPAVEAALDRLAPALEPWLAGRLPARWTALRLLEGEEALLRGLSDALGDPIGDPAVSAALTAAWEGLSAAGMDREALREAVAATLVHTAALAAEETVGGGTGRSRRDEVLDRLFTSRATGVPVMLCLLALALWISLAGANLPSALLSQALFWVQDRLTDLFQLLGAPDWLHGALVLGAYRTLAWVVSVMLPPMAIFFPLFALLEDFGYLPRVAFLLDHAFQKARSCGKQALTMWLGKNGVRRTRGSGSGPLAVPAAGEVLQADHPGAQPLQQGRAVADDEEPQAPALRLLQEEGPELGLGDEVQHGGELVTQEIAGPRPQGPGHAEALELPAGELGGVALQPAGLDVQALQDPLLHRPALGQRGPQSAQGVHHQLRVLPDHLHRTGPPPGGEGPPVHQHLPGVRPLVPGEELAQCGLPPAAGGGEPQPLPGPEGQADLGEDGLPPPAVAEGEAPGLQAHDASPLSGWRHRTRPPATAR